MDKSNYGDGCFRRVPVEGCICAEIDIADGKEVELSLNNKLILTITHEGVVLNTAVDPQLGICLDEKGTVIVKQGKPSRFIITDSSLAGARQKAYDERVAFGESLFADCPKPESILEIPVPDSIHQNRSIAAAAVMLPGVFDLPKVVRDDPDYNSFVQDSTREV